MPLFRFDALNSGGRRQVGECEAASRDELAAAFERAGWVIVHLTEASPAGADVEVFEGEFEPDEAPLLEEVLEHTAPLEPSPSPKPAEHRPREPRRSAKRHERSRRRDRLSRQEAFDFSEHLARMTKAGLPLEEGLRALATELPSGRMRRLVLELAQRLEEGQPLDVALADLRRRFPGHLASLIQASIKSGKLGLVLGEFATYAQLGETLRQTIWSSLAYPLLLLVAFSSLVMVFLWYVVHQFEMIFADFGVSLPRLTMLIITLSRVLQSWPLLIALGPVVTIAVLYLASRVFLRAPTRRWLINRLPLIGKLVHWTALSEFAHQLGLLVEAGVELPAAVTLAGRASRDAELSSESRRIAREVKMGRSLADAAASSPAVPSGFVKLLRWASGQQALSKTLHVIGSIFEAQARARASFVTSVITSSVIVTIVWGIGIVVIALFLPLITLISKLSG